MSRTCAFAVVGAAALSCAATIGVVRLTETREMSIETAMQLVGKELSPEQRSVVVAALRRQSLIAIRQLQRMLSDPSDRVRYNATLALVEIGEESR